jgi:hypothetical protein
MVLQGNSFIGPTGGGPVSANSQARVTILGNVIIRGAVFGRGGWYNPRDLNYDLLLLADFARATPHVVRTDRDEVWHLVSKSDPRPDAHQLTDSCICGAVQAPIHFYARERMIVPHLKFKTPAVGKLEG